MGDPRVRDLSTGVLSFPGVPPSPGAPLSPGVRLSLRRWDEPHPLYKPDYRYLCENLRGVITYWQQEYEELRVASTAYIDGLQEEIRRLATELAAAKKRDQEACEPAAPTTPKAMCAFPWDT
ncbi:hypothetical protein VD0002_g8455 [Verticillium dahliae]|nr:hypothetical protein BJF96_g644 [Verticillium dahliae]CRK21986.1 hypothetical protein BN1708_013254 [Verticillium longisporum]PNH36675.1 hypothetical protein BJF96_g631 [Verticillium dahliae]PNH45575.1 hypothetical protein VD0003_g9193 [Verticillium dahliae]PNH59084.1 hypothetical protein VD0002_g8455 [Verticillium dahliae]